MDTNFIKNCRLALLRIKIKATSLFPLIVANMTVHPS